LKLVDIGEATDTRLYDHIAIGGQFNMIIQTPIEIHADGCSLSIDWGVEPGIYIGALLPRADRNQVSPAVVRVGIRVNVDAGCVLWAVYIRCTEWR
jgi:hypothetical protein